MSSVVLSGDTSGAITVAAPAVAGTNTLTLPAQTATLITDSSAALNIGSGQIYKDASGNVGIGTSAVPNNAANRGNFTVNGASTSIIQLSVGGTTTAGAYNYFDGTNLNIASIPASGAITFGTNSATERMRIDSSGNLLVNATSTGSFFDGKADFYGNGSIPAACFKSDGGGGQFTTSHWNTATSGTRIFTKFVLGSSPTEVGSITSTGSSTSYVTTSDYRLKENIAPMTGALDTVAQLKPVTYTWKSSGEATQGFIAHELQAVVPECVTGEKDAVNEDGTIKPQGIDTSFLVATLTAAIQEQQAMIEELKNKVAALEAK